MKKEDFIALGLTEEQATKAAEASGNELKTYVPKHRFDEVSEENKTLKGTVEANNKALEDLKKSTGDAEGLKKQIETLQTENKTKDETHQAELKELKLNNAIKLAIAGKVHDEDLAAGLFDKSKLILGEDGKITGLDDQLKNLQESKKFLFKEEVPPAKPGFVPIGSPPPVPGSNNNNSTVSFKDAVTAAIQAQTK
ncbi:MAG TPA: hypothetical protein GXX75_23350 [Clostridiales bacterium]|nr:hypothetical protein [Clostridiales bacterium]